MVAIEYVKQKDSGKEKNGRQIRRDEAGAIAHAAVPTQRPRDIAASAVLTVSTSESDPFSFPFVSTTTSKHYSQRIYSERL